MAPVVLVHLLMAAWGWTWWVAVPPGDRRRPAPRRRRRARRHPPVPQAPRGCCSPSPPSAWPRCSPASPSLLPRALDETACSPPASTRRSTSDFTIGGVIFTEQRAARADRRCRSPSSPWPRSCSAATSGSPSGPPPTAPTGPASSASRWAASRPLVWAVAGAARLRRRRSCGPGILGLPIGAALSLGVLLRALAALLIGRLTDLAGDRRHRRRPRRARARRGLQRLEPAAASTRSSPPSSAVALLLAAAPGARPAADGDATSLAAPPTRSAPSPPCCARLPEVRLVRGRRPGRARCRRRRPPLRALGRPLAQGLGRAHLRDARALGGGAHRLGRAGVARPGRPSSPSAAAVGAKATIDWDLDLLLALAVAGRRRRRRGAWSSASRPCGCAGSTWRSSTLAVALATTSWLLNRRFFDWVPDAPGASSARRSSGASTSTRPPRIYYLSPRRPARHRPAGPAGHPPQPHRPRAARPPRQRAGAPRPTGFAAAGAALTGFALSGGHRRRRRVPVRPPPAGLRRPALRAGPELRRVHDGGARRRRLVPGAVLGALCLQGTRWFLPGEWQLLATGAGVLLVLLDRPGRPRRARPCASATRWLRPRRRPRTASTSPGFTAPGHRRGRRRRRPRRSPTASPPGRRRGPPPCHDGRHPMTARRPGRGWPTSPAGRPSYPLVVLFGLNAVDELDRTAFGVLLPEIREEFGLDLQGSSPSSASSRSSPSLLQVPIAALRRPHQPGPASPGSAPSRWGVFSLLTGLAATLWMLGIARAGSGIGKAVVDPTHNSLLADYYATRARPRVVLVPPGRQRRRASSSARCRPGSSPRGSAGGCRSSSSPSPPSSSSSWPGGCRSRCGAPTSAGPWAPTRSASPPRRRPVVRRGLADRVEDRDPAAHLVVAAVPRRRRSSASSSLAVAGLRRGLRPRRAGPGLRRRGGRRAGAARRADLRRPHRHPAMAKGPEHVLGSCRGSPSWWPLALVVFAARPERGVAVAANSSSPAASPSSPRASSPRSRSPSRPGPGRSGFSVASLWVIPGLVILPIIGWLGDQLGPPLGHAAHGPRLPDRRA